MLQKRIKTSERVKSPVQFNFEKQESELSLKSPGPLQRIITHEPKPEVYDESKYEMPDLEVIQKQIVTQITHQKTRFIQKLAQGDN